jgi:1-acyl-sn-glycerol-3-phosphate acyltransferase
MLYKLLTILIAVIDKPLFALWQMGGWDYERQVPDVDKFMLAMAPHTTFRDYFHSIPVAIHERRHPSIMMKRELLQFPIIGWFFKLGGGFGVDRGKSHNTVEQVIQYINQQDRMVMIIAPEGTREHTTNWKTGFYHIAAGANIPLVLVYINYATKRVGFSEMYYPTGDIQKDYQWMSEFFEQHGYAKYPDQFGLPDMSILEEHTHTQLKQT